MHPRSAAYQSALPPDDMPPWDVAFWLVAQAADMSDPPKGEGFDPTSAAAFAAQRCMRGIGLVPEGRRIFPDLTVMENLVVGGYSRPRSEQTLNLDHVYDIFPRLHDRQKQLAGSLSGGEQQMLAFGRAMVARPRLMLVDELSLGLMPRVVDECYAALDKLVAAGIAVILVDQNSDAALAFCSSALILESGHMTWSGLAANAPESLTH